MDEPCTRSPPPWDIVFDMDWSASPTHGEQENSLWNRDYACTCYHRLFLFNQFCGIERCTFRPGKGHSADGRDIHYGRQDQQLWQGVLRVFRILFLGLLAFIRRHANNVASKRLPPDISNTASVWPVVATADYPVVAGVGVLRLSFRPVLRRNADTIAILSVAPNITALAPSSGSPYGYSKCKWNHDCDDNNFQNRFRLHCCLLLLFAQLRQLLPRPVYLW
ncbi:MAG: hypothetical protein DLM68_04595 [Hyphomicrobiales bacterium]|nr:MAG: hypothetical protein DLM68_04595 [Hyphomicrobiales bacterium]